VSATGGGAGGGGLIWKTDGSFQGTAIASGGNSGETLFCYPMLTGSGNSLSITIGSGGVAGTNTRHPGTNTSVSSGISGAGGSTSISNESVDIVVLGGLATSQVSLTYNSTSNGDTPFGGTSPNPNQIASVLKRFSSVRSFQMNGALSGGSIQSAYGLTITNVPVGFDLSNIPRGFGGISVFSGGIPGTLNPTQGRTVNASSSGTTLNFANAFSLPYTAGYIVATSPLNTGYGSGGHSAVQYIYVGETTSANTKILNATSGQQGCVDLYYSFGG
jgi:hypothetical protein